MDWIVTGASRGIGRALVRALAQGATASDRIFVLARDADRLGELAREVGGRCEIVALPADLSRLDDTRAAGNRLAAEVRAGATLVHDAGIWPSRRVLVDGIEQAFATNCLCPLALQAPLLDAGLLARVLVVSAGLLVKGRFHEHETPTGEDFSAIRTYCSTKLAGAAAMRDAARRHPRVDFAVVHPGVVNTDLGARGGLLGWILRLVKRKWESPDACAARLVRLLERPHWAERPGGAPWFFEATEQPWPLEVERDERAVLSAVARFLGASP